MKALAINDLSITEELDRKVMSTLRGGRTISMFSRRVWRPLRDDTVETSMEPVTTEAASGELSP